ncbi:hypothetical protein GCM10009773_32120 [Williamsia serinedens]
MLTMVVSTICMNTAMRHAANAAHAIAGRGWMAAPTGGVTTDVSDAVRVGESATSAQRVSEASDGAWSPAEAIARNMSENRAT